MMDRNREARRAAAMTNGLQSQRRRHRTASGSLRESPEGDGQMELQETARLRDRTAKKDRDRETRDPDLDRDLDRLNRNKRQRGVDKYMHGSSRDDVVSGAGDDSSEESINDEDEDDDDGPFRYVPPSNPVSMSSSSTASTLTHRRSYPPPSKDFRSTGMVPSWKDPEETIAFSVPRKARSSSSKRPHDCWTSGGGGGGGAGVVSADQIHRQASSTPVTLNNTAAAPAPSPPPAPVSPSSSTISIRKKIKPNGQKHKPPKACPKSSPSIQDEIEIEVAEVLYGLMRQSQNPSSSKMEVVSNDSAKLDKSTGDSKSVVHPQNSSSSAPPSLPTVAPKRKRARPYQDENPAAWTSPILPKVDLDQAPKAETPSPSSEDNIVGSAVENGDLAISQDPAAAANGVVAEAKALVEELGSRDVRVAVMSAKVEEASLSPKKESQDHNHVESTSTSIKENSALAEKENHREEKFEIDLMALPPPSRGSPEREGVVEYGGGMMGDETSMVTDRDTEAKATEEDDKKGINNSSSIIRGAEFNVNAGEAEAKAVAAEGEPHKHEPQPPHRHQHDNSKERNIDHQLDLEEPDGSTGVNDHKLNIPLHKQPPQLPPQQSPPKAVKDEANVDNKPGQSSSVQLPMSVAAGWHGGLRPMGFVAPLQGVVSMDGTTMTTAPIQPPQFVFSPPRSKRCATHWCIGKSISNHQQMMKVTPFWPGGAAAAGSAPLLCAKAYNLNMVPSPADLHAAGRAGVNSAQDKTHPYAFFPASKDKSPQTPNAPDSSQKKQFLLPQSIPPGPPNNIVHAPAFFFPFGQQQAAATASARPSTAKSPSTAGNVASTTTSSSAPMGTCSTAGPTMSFSYPNMGGSETQFMAFLGNGPYPFPIPAHVGVGAATPYRGSHPQAMSFFNGSYYSPQMLHPSQLQQQQPPPQPAVHSQIQQQNHQNPSLSTASSSQKHLQNQQQMPQGSGASTAGPSNPNLQNFQAAKGRPSQPPHHDMGCGEDSPSTADSRTRPNLGVYNQSFSIPFHSPNFALMTQSSSIGGGSSNTAGIQNGDKKQQQQQSQQPAYPMSFASMNGVTPPGLDISSMTHNHALLQSLPEPARHNYQMLAAAAQAAQAANPKKNNYQDGKTADPSNAEEERKAMASRASGASVGGQSIAFSRDLANSISTVVDTSSRSLNLVPGSGRPTHSLGSIAATNSGASNSQQQQQMLFPKQQQYVAATVATARSKTPVTSNGNVYPDHLTSASVMAAKFPNSLPSFPPLVQSSGAPSQSPHWKNSVMPNTSQVSSPPIVATSTTSTIKNLPQQQGRTQQNHTQISFGAPATNPKPSTTSQGQQPPNNNRAPSPPMMVGSPSNSSVSKSGCGGNPRTGTSTSLGNKSGGAQASSLSSQQGKNSPSPSPSPSISSQKPSILGSPHMMMSTSTTGSKPQMQESQHQPPLSKQSIQQTQLFFSNPYMQGSANTLAGGGYYLQRHRAENQHHHHQQQQQHVLKSQGSAPPATSSGMLSLRNPVSLGNASTTSDPAKAAAAAHSMKGGDPPQGMFHAAQYAAESAGATHQLVPAGYSYVHAVPTVQVKPAEQKQPAGE